MNENFKTWWRKYDEVEKCRLIKDKAIQVNNYHKRRVKALFTESQYTGARTGVRGGRQTTLSANSERASKTYLDSLDELKYMVSHI